MKYIYILISLYFYSCAPSQRDNSPKIMKDFDSIYIIDDASVTKLQKKIELISVIDDKLMNILEKIIKKEKDCENTFRYIKSTDSLLVLSENNLNIIMKNNDNYMLVVGDQLIIVQAAKLNDKLFKKLGYYVNINYFSLREDEIGNFIDYSYWYIKDGKIIKEIINNPCSN